MTALNLSSFKLLIMSAVFIFTGTLPLSAETVTLTCKANGYKAMTLGTSPDNSQMHAESTDPEYFDVIFDEEQKRFTIDHMIFTTIGDFRGGIGMINVSKSEISLIAPLNKIDNKWSIFTVSRFSGKMKMHTSYPVENGTFMMLTEGSCEKAKALF